MFSKKERTGQFNDKLYITKDLGLAKEFGFTVVQKALINCKMK